MSLRKNIRRFLAGLMAGASIQPVSRAATVESAQVMTDAEAALREITYDHGMVAVRRELLDNYAGPKTPLTDEIIQMVRASKRFRNPTVDIAGAQMELNRFVQERTH